MKSQNAIQFVWKGTGKEAMNAQVRDAWTCQEENKRLGRLNGGAGE